jgi:putative membrane protein
MKKLSYLMMTLAAAWMIQGCGGAKTSTDKADSANTAKADSSKMSDSSAVSPAITVTKDDAEFAVKAADGGMAEVALAKLAQTKATSAKVREFADMMVTDHGKANDELTALAKAKNITLPATVSADKQKELEDLNKKSGTDFDKAYVDAMVDGHKKTVDLFSDESKNAKDPDLKAFVDKTLPTIKMHLEHIQGIKAGMK